jgi:hypothetical protein
MKLVLRLVATGVDGSSRSVDVQEIVSRSDPGDIAESSACTGGFGTARPKDAKITLERIRAVMPVFQGEQGGRKRDPAWRRLWTALREIDRYLSSQSAWLVNDAERHRAGLRVGTSLTEATANFLVNRRMNKAQQMRWSRRGADLLLQVRYATTNSVPASASSSKPVPAPKRLWLPDPHSVDGPASGHHFSPPAIDFMGSIGFIGSWAGMA